MTGHNWASVYDNLPPQEFTKRLPGLYREFGTPSDKPVIACVNVDRTYLPVVNGIDPGSVVSINHAIVACKCCGDDMWIGPQQARAVGTRICYVCLAILIEYTGQAPTPVTLDPHADDVPRRFA